MRSPAPSSWVRPSIDEPGAVDVTMLQSELGGGARRRRRSPSGRVLHGDRVHRRAAGRTHGAWPRPTERAQSSDSIVAVVVFSGHAEGDEQCIADHGTALDISSGGTIAEFDLPEPLRTVASDHAGLMAGTTPTGALWVGTLDPGRPGTCCLPEISAPSTSGGRHESNTRLAGRARRSRRGMCLARLVARQPGGDAEQQRTRPTRASPTSPRAPRRCRGVRVLGDRRARRSPRPVGGHDPDSHPRPTAHRRLRAGAGTAVRHPRRSRFSRHRELRHVAAPRDDRRPPRCRRHRRARHRPARCDRLPRPAGRIGLVRGVGGGGRRMWHPARRRRRRLRSGRPRPRCRGGARGVGLRPDRLPRPVVRQRRRAGLRRKIPRAARRRGPRFGHRP